MWKSLHAAAFYTPGSPLHSASRQHWGQLVRLARPVPSRRTAARRRSTGQTAPSKIPGTRSGMPGIFLFRSDERHAGGVLSLSTSAAAKGGKLYPMRAFAGRRRSAHRPACFRSTAARRRTAPDKPPHRKIPGTRSGMPGIFYLFTAAVPGVTSARRSHGLPL